MLDGGYLRGGVAVCGMGKGRRRVNALKGWVWRSRFGFCITFIHCSFIEPFLCCSWKRLWKEDGSEVHGAGVLT